MSIRSEKVASVIKRAITQPLSVLASEYSAGLLSVTSVKLSPDLQIAKIYFNTYGGSISAAQFLVIIKDNMGKLRKYISSTIRLRLAPELRFYVDDTLDQIQHIQDLLDKVKSEAKEVKVNLDEYDKKIISDL